MGNIRPYHDGLKFASRVRAGFEYAFTDDLVGSVFADYQFIGKMPFNGEDKDSKDEAFPGREIFAIIPQIGLTYYFGPDKEIENKKSPPKPTPVVAAAAVAEMDDDKDGIVNSKDKCPGTEPGVMVNAYGCKPEEKASMTIQVLFPTGSSKLGAEANPHLDEIAAFLNEHPDTKMEIQGHTDNTGSAKRNRELSEARANSVRKYLVEQAGIPASRVTAYGYGPDKPVADNNTESGRSQNRRVIGVISQ
jgi:OOP family OmpA-OmpF porin